MEKAQNVVIAVTIHLNRGTQRYLIPFSWLEFLHLFVANIRIRVYTFH